LALELKSKEGARSKIYSETVTGERISKFSRAVGAEAHPNGIAPPTFMTVFRKGEFELFASLGLKLESLLHAEQLYDYRSDIRSGDRIEFHTTLSHVLEKKCGKQ
jgi:hypothetical protein